ncbi:ABC transporter permease [candidate division KSB1 bacterium]|nr:ABC transporter permease [candidate division KSB1 bacterium]
MFKHYLRIAVRNFLKHKSYSFINVVGLAIGLACCFVIVLYVRHELSYDRFHANADRIYRLLHTPAQDPNQRSAISASAYAPHLQQEFPDLEVVRFFTNGSRVNLKYGAETRTVDGFFYADSSVFQVFTFPLRQGDPKTALIAPNTMVMTPAAARAWFGNEDPVGKSLTFLGGLANWEMRVTGILESISSNSHLQFEYLASFSTVKGFMGEKALEEYINFNYYTYLLLPPAAQPQQLAARFPDFLRKHRGEDTAKNTALALQPLTDIHLTTDVRWDVGTNSDKKYLYIFSIVAFFILIIAGINFINLATARATLRAREVGVRKVVGAYRRQLMLQLFGESIFASVLAMILALASLQLLAPFISSLLGREISFDPFADTGMLLMLIGLGLLTGILAGIYPAVVLSAFDPAKVLKGLVTRGVKGARLRKSLIVVQFGIAVFLLVAIVTLYNQLHYMKTRDLGFKKEQVIFLGLSREVKGRFETFRQNLLSSANILNVALAGSVPGRVGTSRGYNWPGQQQDQDNKSFYTMFGDHQTVEALGLQLLQGRSFSGEIATDVTSAYILNETAVRELGWDDPVAKPFKVWDEEMGQVIGVVKDFNFRSLHQQIEPLVLDIKPEWSWSAAIRIAPNDVASTLSFIETQWRALEPDLPLSYRFLDEDFDRLYRSEEKLGQLFSSFAFLALFVACLGLFGLASFTAEQRTREIGIRKVLGASVTEILLLLSKEFTKLVAFAFVVAAPFAYLAMSEWLQNFAYHIRLGASPFLLGGGLALFIALVTVSAQAIKAALANPVEALRYE